ncbi:MAG: heme peroxidase [Chloroflexia bacterium]|nr:heme peroxidase [Chloroflexia bacterium]
MAVQQRSTVRDGRGNKLETYVLTHFKPVWTIIQLIPPVRKRVNKILINRVIYKIPTRPYPLSTMAAYTSWDSLTDRTFTGRHLPPATEQANELPAIDAVIQLFERQSKTVRVSPKSTLLFSHFAQWFTDGFLRTDRENYLKNTSNHEIDLCQVYGLTRAHTHLLRTHRRGMLKSQVVHGEEYPCYYYGPDGTASTEFAGLPIVVPPDVDPAKKATLFAMGVERANVQTGYVMMNTLFLREHNRICGELAHAHPDWDDERLFQTARNIAMVLLIKIVVNEYINHIAPYHFKFRFDATSFVKERWYRQNWMSLEFSLVYRWHGLVPDRFRLGGQDFPAEETMFNNAIVTERGLGGLFEDASAQPAGEIGLFNTPHFLLDTERASIELSRLTHLRSYNEYRRLCNYPRVTAFDQITGNRDVQIALEQTYGHVDNIEFYVGLMAEDLRPGSAVAPLIGRLVGIDAFSQALTNPLLSEHVFNERTFSSTGLKIIKRTTSLSDILHRNLPDSKRKYRVSMTRSDSA